MQEDKCSFELSKLAQEKGFDWECDAYFNKENFSFITGKLNSNTETIKNSDNWNNELSLIVRPPHAFLAKWLREKHSLHAHVDLSLITRKNKKTSWIAIVDDIKTNEYFWHSEDENLVFFEYHEAMEAGLTAALQLIDNNKNTQPEKKCFFDALEEWEQSFSCGNCGYEDGKEGYVYQRTVANGEVWRCPECKNEVLVNNMPNEDTY